MVTSAVSKVLQHTDIKIRQHLLTDAHLTRSWRAIRQTMTVLYLPAEVADPSQGKAAGLGAEVKEMRNQGSRHRYRFEPPSTPEGFWDMGFGDSQDSRFWQQPSAEGQTHVGQVNHDLIMQSLPVSLVWQVHIPEGTRLTSSLELSLRDALDVLCPEWQLVANLWDGFTVLAKLHHDGGHPCRTGSAANAFKRQGSGLQILRSSRHCHTCQTCRHDKLNIRIFPTLIDRLHNVQYRTSTWVQRPDE